MNRTALALSVLLANCAAEPAAQDLAAAADLAAPDLSPVDSARVLPDLTALCGEPTCEPGALCQSARGCCSCGPFAAACIAGWTCAEPAANDPRCPAAPPARYAACALPDGVGCWYCAAGSPLYAACVAAKYWSECLQTGAERCWGVSGPTRRCD